MRDYRAWEQEGEFILGTWRHASQGWSVFTQQTVYHPRDNSQRETHWGRAGQIFTVPKPSRHTDHQDQWKDLLLIDTLHRYSNFTDYSNRILLICPIRRIFCMFTLNLSSDANYFADFATVSIHSRWLLPLHSQILWQYLLSWRTRLAISWGTYGSVGRWGAELGDRKLSWKRKKRLGFVHKNKAP